MHSLCSVRAVENALGVTVPTNACLLRNLILAAQIIQDHVIHFYQLAALDWVDAAAALKADPAKTSQLAQSISDWPNSTTAYFTQVQQQLQALINSGQLSIFTNGYFGHPAYQLSPEADLMGVAHYLEALQFQRDFIRVHSILGGKNPHIQTLLVGGIATVLNPDDFSTVNTYWIELMRELFTNAENFVKKVYLPDVLYVAAQYPDWFKYGPGPGNFLTYGGFPVSDQIGSQREENLYFPMGLIVNNDLSKVVPLDQAKITEYVTRSWYTYPNNNEALHPFNGITDPNYTGPQPPYDLLNVDSKYSWVKAPRYDNLVMETGPLSNMLVSYVAGVPSVKQWVDTALGKLSATPAVLNSTLGRIAGRCIQAVVLTEQALVFLNELVANVQSGDTQTQDIRLWDPATWPSQAQGYALLTVPRGGLGHWVSIRNGVIDHYQVIAPSTWNASPRDAAGNPGPYEISLPGTPIADPTKPLEILRTIHSFDPCLACGVTLIDKNGREISYVKVEA